MYHKLGFRGDDIGHYVLPKKGKFIMLSFDRYDGSTAWLMAASIVNLEELDSDYLERDTRFYFDGSRKQCDIPDSFDTLRRWTPQKQKYYFDFDDVLGEQFKIEL